MTEVYCTFVNCIFYKPHDEDYGVCTKDHITLDEAVSERICGCPDAEWIEGKYDLMCSNCEDEQREHDILYEPTYDIDDGSM